VKSTHRAKDQKKGVLTAVIENYTLTKRRVNSYLVFYLILGGTSFSKPLNMSRNLAYHSGNPKFDKFWHLRNLYVTQSKKASRTFRLDGRGHPASVKNQNNP
jgi:hypothetical protein